MIWAKKAVLDKAAAEAKMATQQDTCQGAPLTVYNQLVNLCLLFCRLDPWTSLSILKYEDQYILSHRAKM